MRFLTDNCTFTNPEAGDSHDAGMTPAAGGQSVTLWSDTDSTADDQFLADHPSQNDAGTAEVTLDCSKGTAGVAHVTAIVPRKGALIELKVTSTSSAPPHRQASR